MLSNPLNQDRLVELPIFFFYIQVFFGLLRTKSRSDD